jgi:two-component system, NarL family, response regulator DegU
MSQAIAEPNISVLLAHHSRLECRLLSEALRSDAGFIFARCGPEAADILRTLRDFRAEISLIVDSGAGEHVCEIVRSVRRRYPYCKLVILINESQRGVLPELFRLGVRGVLNIETAEIEFLRRCIVQVNQGHFWLSSRELDVVLQEFSKSCSLQLVNRKGQKLLSPRELEVVTLLAEGLTNRDIASELRISPYTVRNYLSQIFDEVGVSTRTELVRFALASARARIGEGPVRADVTPPTKRSRHASLPEADALTGT